jgi:hypothetical protein
MKKLSIVTALMLAMLTISIAPVFAPISEPHPRDAFWVEPNNSYVGGPPAANGTGIYYDTNNATIGTIFTVTIALNYTGKVFSWQCGFHFNIAWLNCTGIETTEASTSEYFHGIAAKDYGGFSYTIDDVVGFVQGFETCKGAAFIPGPRAATLVWVHFNITATPPKGIVPLTSDFDLMTEHDKKANWVFDPDVGDFVVIANYNGSITFAWAVPSTKPHMGIEPTGFFGSGLHTIANPPPADWTVNYNMFTNDVGSGFMADIYLENIDPAWYVQNVSFTLNWADPVDVVGGLGDISIDGMWTLVGAIGFVPGASLTMALTNYAGPRPALPNKIPVAHVKFTVISQDQVPPSPPSIADRKCDLTFSNVLVADHTLTIATSTPEKGTVDVPALQKLARPWLEISPVATTVGFVPSIGSVFGVNIIVKNLTGNAHCVAIQFRVQYDSSMLAFYDATEGPFMTNTIWNKYGTFFTSVDLVGGGPPFGDNVAVLDLLYPNKHGVYDQATFPNTLESNNVNVTVATIYFTILQQGCFNADNITTFLNILPFWIEPSMPPYDHFIDYNADYINDMPGVNGTVLIASIIPPTPSPYILDLYGGAVNDGYGVLVGSPYLQFPTPYGGQGLNQSMDLVFPQSWVYLHANVTYNWWPVQQKYVGFEIEGPFQHVINQTGDFYVPLPRYQVWAKFSATTDGYGVGSYAYRMPWPCDDPDGITGVWKITATTSVADQLLTDVVLFYYQSPVYITSVSTDKYGYFHDEQVKVCVDYGTHSRQLYPALFAITITDNLGVPIGMALEGPLQVGGARFCTWKNDSFCVTILIPKWAYAGNGLVHVSVYDKDPTDGGEPWRPEYTPDPVINIYPYNAALTLSVAFDPTQWSADGGMNLYSDDVPPDAMPMTATAAGGYPLLAPNNVPQWTYTWYVNDILVYTEFGTTSVFWFDTAVWSAPGLYKVTTVVTDTLGYTATIINYVGVTV